MHILLYARWQDRQMPEAGRSGDRIILIYTNHKSHIQLGIIHRNQVYPMELINHLIDSTTGMDYIPKKYTLHTYGQLYMD
jgi:hypothetical protein